MDTIQKNNFVKVIEALKNAVEQIKEQKKDTAINTILGVANNIGFLNNASVKLKLSAEVEQQKITDTIKEIILSEASIHESYLNTQKCINDLNGAISNNNIKKNEILKQIESLKKELNEDERLLREHRKKLDELNDSSAFSIIRSILSLGLDRAIMGVQCLINNDAGRINELNDSIKKYNEILKNNSDEFNKSDDLLKGLSEQKKLYEVSIAKLKEKESVLHTSEQVSRNNLAFITNAALFYGRLSVMLDQIEHRIDDVVDIVEELNDKTPTIIDFDSSGTSLISLKEAMVKFDKILETSEVA
ncbi:coiled-coil domain-containing protein [Ruminiclostridium cellulolyticum]|uniref:Methyl-accepting chemotaxis sensory transducer n=1 Tax=Ruminiclostridium cellulolyticum (strain ATCC 35319 / DSM 5812 / JCM 6584 / H10) TaxID=394503 RepID=B8I0S5_RUMCH|nr:hypothetical protein [Ruminiclostridium cellulolyticum]ACL75650.1 hypothetical protein Ccel_1295 [Ruminiclostridium cellulolyticum H10]